MSTPVAPPATHATHAALTAHADASTRTVRETAHAATPYAAGKEGDMREKTPRLGLRRVAALALLLLTASVASSASAEIPPDAANHPLLQPIDAQDWVDQGELTWADYLPVPDERPEFYDTLTNNCTTNIVRHINRIRPNRLMAADPRLLPVPVAAPPGPAGPPKRGLPRPILLAGGAVVGLLIGRLTKRDDRDNL